MQELIKTTFENYGFSLTETQILQFEKYFHYLVEENKKFNLTAITQQAEVVRKHFVDSVLPLAEISKNASIIDVGTGAGFPGVPLKILRPDIKLTLLDSLNKRIEFLKRLCQLLNLQGVEFVHARAEDYVKQKREKFDIALSRAVASIPTLSEYLLPYVKVGGCALMYKGSKANEEIEQGKNALNILGGKVVDNKKYFLSEEDGERNVVIVKKIKNTPPKYPRGKNLPKSNPLC